MHLNCVKPLVFLNNVFLDMLDDRKRLGKCGKKYRKALAKNLVLGLLKTMI